MMLLPRHLWHMLLLPIAAWEDPMYGWSFCLIYVTNVITTDADVIAYCICLFWLMLLVIL